MACDGSINRLIRPKGDAADGGGVFQNARTRVYIPGMYFSGIVLLCILPTSLEVLILQVSRLIRPKGDAVHGGCVFQNSRNRVCI